MKTGRTLTEMAQALEAQQAQKKDYVADTRALEMTPAGQLAIQRRLLRSRRTRTSR